MKNKLQKRNKLFYKQQNRQKHDNVNVKVVKSSTTVFSDGENSTLEAKGDQKKNEV